MDLQPKEFEALLPRVQLKLKGLHWPRPGATSCILLHGWLDNCYSFQPLCPLLADYDLYTIDWPGHGHSDWPAPGTLHFQDYLYCLKELIDKLGIGPSILIGHSMGGGVASLFTACFPELVKQLVLIEALGPQSGAEQDAPQLMRRAIEAWQGFEDQGNPVYSSFAKAVATRQKYGSLSEASATLLTQRGAKNTSGDNWQWRHDSRLRLPSARSFSEQQICSYLNKISCRSLLILAEDSYLQSDSRLVNRQKAVRELTSVVLSGGHHLHMDSPDKVASEIISFLLDVEAQR